MDSVVYFLNQLQKNDQNYNNNRENKFTIIYHDDTARLIAKNQDILKVY